MAGDCRQQPQLADHPGRPAVQLRHPRPTGSPPSAPARPPPGSLTDLTGLPDNLLTYGYAFADLTPAGLRRHRPRHPLHRRRLVARRHASTSTAGTAPRGPPPADVDVPGAFGVVADVHRATRQPRGHHPDPAGHRSPTATARPTGVHPARPDRARHRRRRTPSSAASRWRRPRPRVRRSSSGRRSSVTGVPVGSTVPVTAYVDSPAGVGSVQAKLGSGAFVDAHPVAATSGPPTCRPTGLAAGAEHGDRPGHRHAPPPRRPPPSPARSR